MDSRSFVRSSFLFIYLFMYSVIRLFKRLIDLLILRSILRSSLINSGFSWFALKDGSFDPFEFSLVQHFTPFQPFLLVFFVLQFHTSLCLCRCTFIILPFLCTPSFSAPFFGYWSNFCLVSTPWILHFVIFSELFVALELWVSTLCKIIYYHQLILLLLFLENQLKRLPE